LSDNEFNIDGIFDHLTPDDFVRETSAVDAATGEYRGTKNYDRWVDQRLQSVHIAYHAADGHMNPIALLASPTVMRGFTPDDDETVGDFLERLGREARLIGAHWFFLAKRELVGTMPTDDDDLDVMDQESVQEYINAGKLKPGVLWYAERREGSQRSHRIGFLTIVGNKLGESVETGAPQTFKAFAQVLEAVHTK
jgi:hypothetical protein